jgi:putative ubiquitin-RnfH superfamily antitoxin RatB of RatAB toxin-antitoxin module
VAAEREQDSSPHPNGAPVEAGAATETLRIEVVYARPDRAIRVRLELPAGSTARDAFEASGLRGRVPELLDTEPDLGVFAHPVQLGHRLRDGDRLEVYRPLQIDPKDARRQRAAQSRG